MRTLLIAISFFCLSYSAGRAEQYNGLTSEPTAQYFLREIPNFQFEADWMQVTWEKFALEDFPKIKISWRRRYRNLDRGRLCLSLTDDKGLYQFFLYEEWAGNKERVHEIYWQYRYNPELLVVENRLIVKQGSWEDFLQTCGPLDRIFETDN